VNGWTRKQRKSRKLAHLSRRLENLTYRFGSALGPQVHRSQKRNRQKRWDVLEQVLSNWLYGGRSPSLEGFFKDSRFLGSRRDRGESGPLIFLRAKSSDSCVEAEAKEIDLVKQMFRQPSWHPRHNFSVSWIFGCLVFFYPDSETGVLKGFISCHVLSGFEL
jgi:hypothetical protein